MHYDQSPINRFSSAPRFAPFENVARVVGRVLLGMDDCTVVEPGSREWHRAEAMRAAYMVAHQFTHQAKKQAKRDCLGHLIASLAPGGASKNKALSV